MNILLSVHDGLLINEKREAFIDSFRYGLESKVKAPEESGEEVSLRVTDSGSEKYILADSAATVKSELTNSDNGSKIKMIFRLEKDGEII